MGRDTLEKVKELEASLKSQQDDVAHKDQYGGGFEYRIPKEIELTKLNVGYESIKSGLLIKDKYIIATRKNKWRVLGKNTWYWYTSVPQLLDKLRIEYDR